MRKIFAVSIVVLILAFSIFLNISIADSNEVYNNELYEIITRVRALFWFASDAYDSGKAAVMEEALLDITNELDSIDSDLRYLHGRLFPDTSPWNPDKNPYSFRNGR